MKIIINTIVIIILFQPLNLSAREFLNTYFHINFLFMYSLTAFGDVIDKEHDSYFIQDPDSGMKSIRPDHHDEAYGVLLDITPIPAMVFGNEGHAIKLGLRVGYRFHSLQQEIILEKSDYGGNLMKFNTLMYGPVLYYAPSIEPSKIGHNYQADKGLVFYLLYGKLQKAEYTAYPSMRDNGVAPTGDYTSEITGYKVDIGVGGEVSICGSLNLGINLYYSMIRFTMSDQVYSGISRDTSINEICAEIYLGIPVQYF